MKTEYFKIKIVKHTPLLFQSEYCDMWHKDKVGSVILVRKTQHDGAYYECKTGESILKSDCAILADLDQIDAYQTINRQFTDDDKDIPLENIED